MLRLNSLKIFLQRSVRLDGEDSLFHPLVLGVTGSKMTLVSTPPTLDPHLGPESMTLGLELLFVLYAQQLDELEADISYENASNQSENSTQSEEQDHTCILGGAESVGSV